MAVSPVKMHRKKRKPVAKEVVAEVKRNFDKFLTVLKIRYSSALKILSKKRTFLRDVLLINVLLYIIILVLGLIAFNVSFLDPFKQAFKDFSFANVYFSRMIDTNRVDTNIILINTGSLSREGIGRQIRILNKYKPGVIGIDHLFLERKENDSILSSAISECPALTGVCYLDDFSKGKYHSVQKSNPYFLIHDQGFVNYPAEDPVFSTIRYARFAYIIEKDTVFSFPVAVIRKFSPELFLKSAPLMDGIHIINFIGNKNSFITLDTGQVTDTGQDLVFLKNKIVLMGYMGDSLNARTKLEDLYYTPLNKRLAGRTYPDMYGVVIHANIISMIFGGRFIRSVPFALECVFAFVITFLHLLLIVRLYQRSHKHFEFLTIVIRYTSSAILLYLYFLLFAKMNISFDMTLAIIGLISLKIVIIIYYEIVKFLGDSVYLKSFKTHEK
ncbi:MAG: CHASE2 domain-containing protein [Bacteroidetes bacterium]|nr:CHASE2 domain-containing protein [Bacteroidota bacterium]